MAQTREENIAQTGDGFPLTIEGSKDWLVNVLFFHDPKGAPLQWAQNPLEWNLAVSHITMTAEKAVKLAIDLNSLLYNHFRLGSLDDDRATRLGPEQGKSCFFPKLSSKGGFRVAADLVKILECRQARVKFQKILSNSNSKEKAENQINYLLMNYSDRLGIPEEKLNPSWRIQNDSILCSQIIPIKAAETICWNIVSKMCHEGVEKGANSIYKIGDLYGVVIINLSQNLLTKEHARQKEIKLNEKMVGRIIPFANQFLNPYSGNEWHVDWKRENITYSIPCQNLDLVSDRAQIREFKETLSAVFEVNAKKAGFSQKDKKEWFSMLLGYTAVLPNAAHPELIGISIPFRNVCAYGLNSAAGSYNLLPYIPGALTGGSVQLKQKPRLFPIIMRQITSYLTGKDNAVLFTIDRAASNALAESKKAGAPGFFENRKQRLQGSELVLVADFLNRFVAPFGDQLWKTDGTNVIYNAPSASAASVGIDKDYQTAFQNFLDKAAKAMGLTEETTNYLKVNLTRENRYTLTDHSFLKIILDVAAKNNNSYTASAGPVSFR